MTKQAKTDNLNFFIDPTFNKVNRLFVRSFKKEDGRTCFQKHYAPSVELKFIHQVLMES